MRARILTACIATLLLGAPLAVAQIAGNDHFATAAGPVEINLIHHASLMLASKDVRILSDGEAPPSSEQTLACELLSRRIVGCV